MKNKFFKGAFLFFLALTVTSCALYSRPEIDNTSGETNSDKGSVTTEVTSDNNPSLETTDSSETSTETIDTPVEEKHFGFTFDKHRNKISDYTSTDNWNNDIVKKSIKVNKDNKFISFEASGIRTNDNCWQELKKDTGYIKNEEPLYGISNITITYEAKNIHQCIYFYNSSKPFDLVEDANLHYSNNYPMELGLQTVNFEFLRPNYFALKVSGDDLTIHSMTIAMDENYHNYYHKVEFESEFKDVGLFEGFGEYLEGENIHLSFRPLPHFSFVGWYLGDELISSKSDFFYIVPNHDVKLLCKIEYVYYTLTVKPNQHYGKDSGIVTGGGKYHAGQEVTVTATANEGYVFDCWAAKGRGCVSSDATYTFTMPNHDYDLTACFDAINYRVDVILENPNDGEVNGTGIYFNIGQKITLEIIPKPGKSPTGWVYNGKVVSTELTYSFIMEAHDYVFYNSFVERPFKHVAVSNDETLGTVSLEHSERTVFQGNIAYAHERAGKFVGWFDEDNNLLSKEKKYKFEAPNRDLTLTGKFRPLKEFVIGEKIYMGSFPQSKVTDETLLKKLMEKVGKIPTTQEEFYKAGWGGLYFTHGVPNPTYGYYEPKYNNQYSHSLEITLEDGSKYLCVYQQMYRAHDSYGAFSDNGLAKVKGYLLNTPYFFKYEPVEFEAVSKEGLFVSSKVLYSYPFNDLFETSIYGYENTYSLSNLKSRSDWIYTSFTLEEKEMVPPSRINSNPGNYKDNLFSLSKEEVEQYLIPNGMEKCGSTDYADCLGINFNKEGNVSFYTRTPFEDEYHQSAIICDCNGQLIEESVFKTYVGHRYAFKIAR